MAYVGDGKLQPSKPDRRSGQEGLRRRCHLENTGDESHTRYPYLARQLSVFRPGGSSTGNEFTRACALIQMVMQTDTRFILVRAKECPTSSGGGKTCIACTEVLVQG